MPKTEKLDITKDRILDEAEILFAQKGYHAVSVREITAAAKCNLAAVNYHFGNKKNLYMDVFRCRWVSRAHRVQAQFLKLLEGQAVTSPKIIIEAMARAFLEGPLTDEERRRHHQLIMRETSQPTEAFEMVVQAIRPMNNQIRDLLRDFIPPEVEEEGLMLSLLSILSMVLYFNLARTMVSQLTGREYDQAFTSQLIDHIVDFSLNGLSLTKKESSS